MTPTILGQLAGSLPRASTAAGRTDLIFWTLTAICGGVLLLLFALNLTFLVRYRRGSPAKRGPLPIATWKIEAGWIGATTLAFLGIFAWGAWAYLEAERPPRDAMVIDVVARQWMWDVRQPDGRREFNTLHVPAGRPVVLQLTSEDVIHSLFVPAFRLKQDLVPGKVVDAWFQATRPGTYRLFCTQYCGTAHSAMVGEVIVQTPADYAAWRETGATSPAAAGRGRSLALARGCLGCHAPASPIHAPPLEGLYGKQVALADGTFARADEVYLRDSILEPDKQIVAGYAPVMPSFKGVIPEGEILELVAWIKTLRDETPSALPPPARP